MTFGTYKDLTRHRLASYSIESTRYCVAGDTKLKFSNPHNHFTVAQLYELIQNSKNGQWKRMKIRQLNEDTGVLQFSKINNVYKTGKKKCFKIKTDLNYDLICTEDHQIYTPNGYKKLKDLNIGDLIYVNGKNIDKPIYQDYDWMYYQYVTLNKSYIQIANEFNFKLTTIKKWGHKLNMPYKGCGYKNIGRSPWNKGLSEYEDKRVNKQANALRKNRYNKWIKNTYNVSPNGKVILENTENTYRKYIKDHCEICGRKKCKLEVHHKDGHHSNFKKNNFITCCPKCYQGIENKNLQIIYPDKIISIEEVGEIDVYDIEMKNNYHNFVANGIVVHNCNYSKDKFDNQIKFIKPIFYTSGTMEEYEDPIDKNNCLKTQYWERCMKFIENDYLDMTNIAGAKPDELRMILPHSTAAEVTMTANIREWRHIFELRCSKMTHPSVQQVMIPLLLKFKEDMPEIFGDIEYNKEFPKEKYAKIMKGEENA